MRQPVSACQVNNFFRAEAGDCIEWNSRNNGANDPINIVLWNGAPHEMARGGWPTEYGLQSRSFRAMSLPRHFVFEGSAVSQVS